MHVNYNVICFLYFSFAHLLYSGKGKPNSGVSTRHIASMRASMVKGMSFTDAHKKANEEEDTAQEKAEIKVYQPYISIYMPVAYYYFFLNVISFQYIFLCFLLICRLLWWRGLEAEEGAVASLSSHILSHSQLSAHCSNEIGKLADTNENHILIQMCFSPVFKKQFTDYVRHSHVFSPFLFSVVCVGNTVQSSTTVS